MHLELNGARETSGPDNDKWDSVRNARNGNRRGFFEQVLQLPVVEPWPEAVNLSALLDRIVWTLNLFLVLPKWAAETLALWVVHTYAFHLRDMTAYIGLESPTHRCGKTTLVTVLSELAHRAVVASNVSSPALFRVIEELQPTLLIDEADTFLQGNDELRGILNSGNKSKTAYVLRVVSEVRNSAFAEATADKTELGVRSEKSANGRERDCDSAFPTPNSAISGTRLARFSCWCPKLIARIGRLPVTLADRCILIQMQRKTGQEKCERLRKLQSEEVRRQCARFVLDHAEAIRSAEPQIPGELNDRAADIWEPLLALADLAGGRWPSLAREAAIGLTGSADENNPAGALLLDILVLFTVMDTEKLFSRTIVESLNSLSDPAWAELGKGKQMTELLLARLLRGYGVRPRTIWVGEVSAKGYVKGDFGDLFRRYITKSQVEALKAGVIKDAAENNGDRKTRKAEGEIRPD